VLVVLVDTVRLRWLVAALGLDGVLLPLLRSEEGDLALYQGQPFDEQVSFLRHRFCNVLQRGCDRLWPVGKKACHFVFLFDGILPGATEELTLQVSEHFVEWMLNPPVVVFTVERENAIPQLTRLAGSIDPSREDLVRTAIVPLFAAAADPAAWDLSQHKGTWQPSASV
jgi:hypothetical protein